MLTTVLLKLKRDELLTVLQSGGMRLVGNEKQRLNRSQLIDKARADLCSF